MGYMTQEHFQVASRHLASYFKGKAKQGVIDGESYKYLEVGPKGKQTILFLHGLGNNKSTWRSQMLGYCDEQYRRIAVDIPGACLTKTFTNKKHSLGELSRWLDKVIEQLDLGEVHLVAHSSISLMGAYYAGSRHDKVKTLTMIAVPDIWSSNALLPGGPIDRFRREVNFSNVDDAIKFFNSMFYDAPKLPKALHVLTYNQQKEFLGTLLKILDEFVESVPLLMSHTRKVKCPTLILCGEHDPYSSEEFVNSLHWHFPHAQVISFSKSGHVPMLEQPVEVIGLHNEFIRTTRVRNLSSTHNIVHSSYSNA